MAICPNEHVHFLLLALRDQDREWVLVLLAELLASLVVPGNSLPQSPSARVTDEGLILADRLLREGATRRRAQALDVPSIAEESAPARPPLSTRWRTRWPAWATSPPSCWRTER